VEDAGGLLRDRPLGLDFGEGWVILLRDPDRPLGLGTVLGFFGEVRGLLFCFPGLDLLPLLPVFFSLLFLSVFLGEELE